MGGSEAWGGTLLGWARYVCVELDLNTTRQARQARPRAPRAPLYRLSSRVVLCGAEPACCLCAPTDRINLGDVAADAHARMQNGPARTHWRADMPRWVPWVRTRRRTPPLSRCAKLGTQRRHVPLCKLLGVRASRHLASLNSTLSRHPLKQVRRDDEVVRSVEARCCLPCARYAPRRAAPRRLRETRCARAYACHNWRPTRRALGPRYQTVSRADKSPNSLTRTS